MAKQIINRDKKKKRYSVTLYYHTNLTLDAIYADNEQEAIDVARAMSEKAVNQKYILYGLQEDNAPDVEELNV